VDEIREWVSEIADAAAQMTQVDINERYITGCYDYLPNETLLGVLWENMQTAGPIDFTTEDEEFASKLKSTLNEQTVRRQTRHLPDPVRSEVRKQTLYSSPVEMSPSDQHSSGSTDVGDVSWIAPTGQFTGATWPVGTPHTLGKQLRRTGASV
jgi:aminobenzoyl-glutamate utilization protein B